jgi:hypothetical protein
MGQVVTCSGFVTRRSGYKKTAERGYNRAQDAILPTNHRDETDM